MWPLRAPAAVPSVRCPIRAARRGAVASVQAWGCLGLPAGTFVTPRAGVTPSPPLGVPCLALLQLGLGSGTLLPEVDLPAPWCSDKQKKKPLQPPPKHRHRAPHKVTPSQLARRSLASRGTPRGGTARGPGRLQGCLSAPPLLCIFLRARLWSGGTRGLPAEPVLPARPRGRLAGMLTWYAAQQDASRFASFEAELVMSCGFSRREARRSRLAMGARGFALRRVSLRDPKARPALPEHIPAVLTPKSTRRRSPAGCPGSSLALLGTSRALARRGRAPAPGGDPAMRVGCSPC